MLCRVILAWFEVISVVYFWIIKPKIANYRFLPLNIIIILINALLWATYEFEMAYEYATGEMCFLHKAIYGCRLYYTLYMFYMTLSTLLYLEMRKHGGKMPKIDLKKQVSDIDVEDPMQAADSGDSESEDSDDSDAEEELEMTHT